MPDLSLKRQIGELAAQVDRINRALSKLPGREPRGVRPPVRCRVISEHNDYLVCQSWNGVVQGTIDLYVAKPRELRHDVDLYDGITTLSTDDVNQIEVSDGTTTETWMVTLPYKLGTGEVLAEHRASGVFIGDDELLLVDTNRAGRSWAQSCE